MEKLYIIGMGPGDSRLLTEEAKARLQEAKTVLNTREIPLPKIYKSLETPIEGGAALVVSGDCGFFSVSKKIIQNFSKLYDIEVCPGIGCIQYFSGKIMAPYEDWALVSLHGRECEILSKAAYNKKVFALTGGKNSPSEICARLSRYGLGGVSVTVGERLSLPGERITTGSASQLAEKEFDSLSVIYIENPSAVNPHLPLRDEDFKRLPSVPMTKEEIRRLSIGKLGISPADIVYDIGAGTGSVSVEMARKAFDGFVYAIEQKPEACSLVKENAANNGAFNIEVVNGTAPAALERLPMPDKAFIGGSGGGLNANLDKLFSLNPRIRLTINAITLETLNQATSYFRSRKLAEPEVICVNISKARKLGGYSMMEASNPVYIITAGGGDE